MADLTVFSPACRFRVAVDDSMMGDRRSVMAVAGPYFSILLFTQGTHCTGGIDSVASLAGVINFDVVRTPHVHGCDSSISYNMEN